MFLSPWKYHKFDKYVQGNFNLGMHESYQAEMSFPLVAANPCICQNLWVCYILDWVWFNCPELHHRVKTLPSVTLGNIQICPAVMKSSLGLPLASCSTKGRSRFLPVAVINPAFLHAHSSTWSLLLLSSGFLQSSLVLLCFLLKKTKILSHFKHVTDILLGLLCAGVEVRSHAELFAQLDKDKSNEFISVQT